MDILEKLAIEVPCSACGGRYNVTLKQILLSRQMSPEGCPVQVVDECPSLAYFDRNLTSPPTPSRSARHECAADNRPLLWRTSWSKRTRARY